MKIYKKSMLIEESDNVAVAVEPIQAGECTLVAGEEITANEYIKEEGRGQRPGLCPIHTSSPGASISNPARSHNKRCVEPPRFRRGAVSFGRVFPPHGCSPPRCSRSTRITRFMPSVRYLLRWRTRK